MPATLSTITGTFAREQRTRAVSAWAAVAGGAAVLGLLTSGIVLEVWSWPAVFGLNVVLAAAAIAGTLRFVPESAEPGAPRLDVGGAVLAVIGLVALVYSIIEAPDQGWTSARTLAGLAAGLVVLAGFVAWERHRRHPMLDPRVFARRGLAAGSLAVFVQFFGLFGFIFIVLQYLQLIRGDSGLVSALAMLPMAAAMQPAARLAPALAARFGARATTAAGLTLIAAALVVLAQLNATSGYWLLAVGLIPLGAGLGLAMPPATSGITAALPASRQGVGSALNDLSRETGGAVGIAVLASVLTAAYASHLHLTGLPAAQAGAARSSVAVAARLGGAAAAQARTAFADGMHLALFIAAGIVAAAAIAVVILLRGHDRAPDENTAGIPAPAPVRSDGPEAIMTPAPRSAADRPVPPRRPRRGPALCRRGGGQDLVQQPGADRDHQRGVQVVAGHRAQIGRAAPGIDREVRVESARDLLADPPEAVADQRQRRQRRRGPPRHLPRRGHEA
jgi:MFS family permease